MSYQWTPLVSRPRGISKGWPIADALHVSVWGGFGNALPIVHCPRTSGRFEHLLLYNKIKFWLIKLYIPFMWQQHENPAEIETNEIQNDNHLGRLKTSTHLGNVHKWH